MPLALAAPASDRAPAAHAAATFGGSGWTATASSFRGQNGAQFDFTCPSYGQIGVVTGTDTYTDDSSVCSAAVHVGLITLWGGGTVTIEIRPDEPAGYTGSTRNRVTTASAATGPGGSFVVVSALPNNPGIGSGGKGWNVTATTFAQYIGAQFSIKCPAGGTPVPIYGTDIYTSYSSVCTAAVHGGLITVAKGGRVIIEMRSGQASYRASDQNGIKSQKAGAAQSSFVVVDAPETDATPDGVATGDVTVNGKPFSEGQVPFGSSVDVSAGTLTLQANNVGTLLTFGSGTEPARYVLKKTVEKVGSKKRVTAQLNLAGGDFGSCSASGASARASANQKAVRSLWTNGKGRFRTKGRFSSATIRGTSWETTDRCDGTLTTVKTGAVAVTDTVKNKVVIVKAGNTYLAAAK